MSSGKNVVTLILFMVDDFLGGLLYETGLYSRQASIQDRLMCSSCAIISSIHSAEHAYRNSTFVCSIHDFPYNKLNKN